MLIASRFKRPNAPIELPNGDGTFQRYFFRPIDPNAPESEHVAQVTNAAHIGRLLGIAEGYYVSEAGETLRAAAAAAAAGIQNPATPPAAPPAGPTAGEAPVAPAQDSGAPPAPAPQGEQNAPPAAAAADNAGSVEEKAIALLDQPLSKIKADIGSTSKAVLERALAIELAKGEDERSTVTKALRAAITG